MLVTAEEVKELVDKAGMKRFSIHHCGFCKYPCGFLFYAFEEHEVVYDNGCDCVTYDGLRVSSWQELADFINIQTSTAAQGLLDRLSRDQEA